MYRSYEAIEGGYPEEALEDFSGGIGEMVLLTEVPEDFQTRLLKAYERKSFIGISSVNEPEVWNLTGISSEQIIGLKAYTFQLYRKVRKFQKIR